MVSLFVNSNQTDCCHCDKDIGKLFLVFFVTFSELTPGNKSVGLFSNDFCETSGEKTWFYFRSVHQLSNQHSVFCKEMSFVVTLGRI